MKTNQLTPKSILLKRLENALSKSDFKDMEIALPVAEEYKVSSKIIKKVAQEIAGFHFGANRFDQALIFFNKVRSIDPSKKKVFELFCKSASEFFNINIDEFSKRDLEEFKQAILPVIDFHRLKFPAHFKIIDSIEQMFRRIDYRIKFVAKDVKESKLTSRVQQIKSALYSDMSPDEVRQEFARLIVPKLREHLRSQTVKDDELDEKDNKGNKKKKSKKLNHSKKIIKK